MPSLRSAELDKGTKTLAPVPSAKYNLRARHHISKPKMSAAAGSKTWTDENCQILLDLIVAERESGNINSRSKSVSSYGWKRIVPAFKHKTGLKCSASNLKMKYDEMRSYYINHMDLKNKQSGLGFEADNCELLGETSLWNDIGEDKKEFATPPPCIETLHDIYGNVKGKNAVPSFCGPRRGRTRSDPHEMFETRLMELKKQRALSPAQTPKSGSKHRESTGGRKSRLGSTRAESRLVAAATQISSLASQFKPLQRTDHRESLLEAAFKKLADDGLDENSPYFRCASIVCQDPAETHQLLQLKTAEGRKTWIKDHYRLLKVKMGLTGSDWEELL